MIKLHFTKKIILNVALLSAAILAIVFGVILPSMRYIQKTSEETSKLRLYLEEKFQQAKNARISKKRIGEVQATVNEFSSHLFRRGEELKLITYLEALSSKHKLTQSIKESNLDMAAKNKIIISTNLTGSYLDALRYIAEIEASPYFINLENVRLNPIFDRSGSVSNAITLSLTMELHAN